MTPQPRKNRRPDPWRSMAPPIRTCLGCGSKKDKGDLVRLVLRVGVVVADSEGRLPGRGAYCCATPACYQRLGRQRKRLAWALRCQEQGDPATMTFAPGLAALFGLGPG